MALICSTHQNEGHISYQPTLIDPETDIDMGTRYPRSRLALSL